MSKRQKNNNPWYIYNSKRFPRNLYYYNISTGQSLWANNETNMPNQYNYYREPSISDDTLSDDSLNISEYHNLINGEVTHNANESSKPIKLFQSVQQDKNKPTGIFGQHNVVHSRSRQANPTNSELVWSKNSTLQDIRNDNKTLDEASNNVLSNRFKLLSLENILKEPKHQIGTRKFNMVKYTSNSKAFSKSTVFKADKLKGILKKEKKINKPTIRLNCIDSRNFSRVMDMNNFESRNLNKTITGNAEPKDNNNNFQGLSERNTNLGIIEHFDINMLRDLRGVSTKTGLWYVIVDTGVLVQDFAFIDLFIQKDENCRLLIPHAVKRYIEDMSLGDCLEPCYVFTARLLHQMLGNAASHIIVQYVSKYNNNMRMTDSILYCCQEVLAQKYHGVIITTDDHLYEKANAINLHCFKLQNLKENKTVTETKENPHLMKESQHKESPNNNHNLMPHTAVPGRSSMDPNKVLNYLKANFKNWKSYDEQNVASKIPNACNVIRTTGRDLSSTKIMYDKQMIQINSGDNLKISKGQNNKTVIQKKSKKTVVESEDNNKSINVDIIDECINVRELKGDTPKTISAKLIAGSVISEASGYFATLHQFLQISSQSLRSGKLQQEEKNDIQIKIDTSLKSIENLIIQFKGIIEREASSSTNMEAVLAKQGIQLLDAHILTKYRSKVKELMQAANSFKTLLKMLRSDILKK